MKYTEEFKAGIVRQMMPPLSELGYFVGTLGRKNVCVLYKKMDDAGAWCFELAKEIRAAGIDIDLNKLA